ncbi:hypothetical protein [Variovorax sp. LjRoot175]|uniref:hypothetical protein n=1 Tax=Variovorax sp. LjRoot175 TaxID=3342276 RepID=UPI003F519644
METAAIALAWSLFRHPRRTTSHGMAMYAITTTVPTIVTTAVPTTATHAGTATAMACLIVTTDARTIRIDAERGSATWHRLSMPHPSSRSTKCPFEPL